MITLTIKSSIIEIILSIGEGIGNFITWILSFLPNDPINLSDNVFNIPEPIQNALSFVNWLIPLADCLTMITVWITLILSIWFIRVILKVAHFI